MSGGPFSILNGVDYMDAMASPQLAKQYAAQPQGILGGFNQYAQDNSASLIGLGAGLLSGDWGAGLQGYQQGMVQDERTRLIKQKQAEEEQRKVEALKLAQQYKLPAAIASDPDSVFGMVKSIEMQRRTPKELSFEQQQFSLLDKDQQAQYRQQKFLGGGNSGPLAEAGQRAQVAKSMGWDINDPATQSYIATGRRPGDDNKVLAGDRTIVYKAEDQNLNLDATINTLTEAEKLNTQTFTGSGSAMWGRLGTSGLPGTGYIDQGKAKATAEFGKIMSYEAIKTMAETLSGATTDNELNKFVEILADPNTPPEIRGRTIQRMKTLAERKRQLNNERINEISGGTYFKNRANGGRGQDAPSAQDAITVDGYTIRQR